jgi:hypothetical protein
MALETQEIVITGSTTTEQAMINATSAVLVDSSDVDDVAMWEYIYETMSHIDQTRTFSNENTLTVTREYDYDTHGVNIRAFYTIAQAAWENAGYTVTITYT